MLRDMDARLTADIHPSLLGGSMLEAARAKLDCLVLKWHRTPQWEGAVLSYRDERLIQESGMGSGGLVLPFLPYVQVGIRASLLVFAPTRGCTLVGKVHKLGSDYIGMLVLGVFNAVLPRAMVDAKYHDSFTGQAFDGFGDGVALEPGLLGDGGEAETTMKVKKKKKKKERPVVVKEGCFLKFVVEDLKEEINLPTIVGSMRGDKCGLVDLTH